MQDGKKYETINKVNRCPAIHSPRATTTNQPTNRAPNEPARPIWSIFWGKNGRLWAKNPYFYERKQKGGQDRQDRHLNLTFQATCEGQLSQFLQCFSLSISIYMPGRRGIHDTPYYRNKYLTSIPQNEYKWKTTI